MSGITGLIVFITAIILSIVIGTKFKVNIGIVAFAFAFIIGIPICGLKAKEVSALFPTNIFMTQFVATFFYGFASLNKSFSGIADRLIYRTKKTKWTVPFMVFIGTFVISMLGAGADATPVIMSPIAFMLAAKAGYDPLLASLAVWGGSVCTIGAKWTPGGAVAYSIWSGALGEADTNVITRWVVVILFLTGLITMTIIFMMNRTGMKEIEMDKPEAFSGVQKKSLMIVLVALLILLVPNIIQTFAPNAVTGWIGKRITIQIVCLVGSIVFAAMKLADSKEVFKSKVPWNSIITICGMATLIALAGTLGIIDELGAWVGNSIPARWMPFMLVLIAGLLSYVVAASSVIYPLFAPMVPALSAVSGLSPVILGLTVMVGANISSLSPVSTGGSMALLGASDQQRDKVTGKQFRIAMYMLAVFCVIFAVLALLGVFG